MIKLDTKGRVLTGRYAGWYILIERVTEEFKGECIDRYYRFLGEKNPKRGYDDWFPDYSSLESAMEGGT